MSINSTKSCFVIDRSSNFALLKDYIYVKRGHCVKICWHDQNLSNSENVLDVLVNYIKQIYHQCIVKRSIFEQRTFQSIFLCGGRLKKQQAYLSRQVSLLWGHSVPENAFLKFFLFSLRDLSACAHNFTRTCNLYPHPLPHPPISPALSKVFLGRLLPADQTLMENPGRSREQP